MASAFEWDRLPHDLQRSILLRLPISTLLLCKSLSRSFLDTIRSPTFLDAYSSLRRGRRFRHRDDLFLLLFADCSRHGLAAAYLPSRACWLPLPLPPLLNHIHASDGSLVVAATGKNSGEDVVCDLFSRTVIPILPRMPHSYILALIADEASSDFRIVAVGSQKPVGNALNAVYVSSQVYDSRSGRWQPKGQLPGHYAMLGNAVFLDGLLFVLGRLPDHLLTFDLDSGEWSVVDVALPPPVFCLHLLVFEGRLFLVGGLEEDVVIARIGIWELDLTKSEKEWRLFCFMPDEYFQEFSVNELVHFQTIDRFGIVCFCNTRESVVLVCDLSSKTWWWPPTFGVIPKRRRSWLGHALDLPMGLLK
ncbi:F-box/kelch-repeat protein At5g15710 [Musa acuminata AAA Group]|uniref:F-box/kelch-repeat protein At5g15710 n=1 Tax=Musa acuminata AAA Group TaxID=214697 RepID=UPI0031E46623